MPWIGSVTKWETTVEIIYYAVYMFGQYWKINSSNIWRHTDDILLQEAIATSEELGQDLEHVEVLQKKFEEFQTDLAAHEERVNEVNQAAGKLTQESHPEAELILKKQEEVNAAWQRLKGLAQQRQGKLFGAAEVQRFNRWVIQGICKHYYTHLLIWMCLVSEIFCSDLQGCGWDNQLD